MKGGCNRGIHMMVADYIQMPTQRYVPVDGLVRLWYVISFRGVGGWVRELPPSPLLSASAPGRDGMADWIKIK